MLINHQKSTRIYSLLPPQELWRQLLIFPTVDLREDGVSLYRNISNYIIWIELASRKVWGLTLWTFTPFISFRLLERVAQRLETAHPRELEAVLAHLATLAGWRKAERLQLPDTVGVKLVVASVEIL